jgi:hypothetical protein
MGKSAAKRKTTDETIPELPRQPQVGDRIRLKVERITAVTEACKLAGWDDFDAYAVRTVIREDPHNPGGGRRLFFDGAPFCFASVDVKLAWNTDDERRAELRRLGWRV